LLHVMTHYGIIQNPPSNGVAQIKRVELCEVKIEYLIKFLLRVK